MREKEVEKGTDIDMHRERERERERDRQRQRQRQRQREREREREREQEKKKKKERKKDRDISNTQKKKTLTEKRRQGNALLCRLLLVHKHKQEHCSEQNLCLVDQIKCQPIQILIGHLHQNVLNSVDDRGKSCRNNAIAHGPAAKDALQTTCTYA